MLSALRSSFAARVDCDLVDRLNYYYSALALLALAICALALALGGHAIACWCPGELTHSMAAYVQTYCWAASTYALPDSEHLRAAADARPPIAAAQPIRYYQWGCARAVQTKWCNWFA